jgi:dCMP deaminase
MTDLDYMRLALEVATESDDPSTQNGAIIVQYGDVVASAPNRFPRGIRETPERWHRSVKLNYVEHSERGAIYDAASNGVNTFGATMYCVFIVCSDCARAIIESGMIELVAIDWHDAVSERWKHSTDIGLEMLKEAGVIIRYIDIKTPFGIHIRRDGNLIEI